MTIRGAKAPVIIAAMLLSAAWLTGHAATITPLIVGGEDAPEDTFPWMAALFETGFTPVSSQFCGGFLIAPGWVVTAAHCLPDGHADHVSVLLDENNLSGASTGVALQSARIHEHFVDNEDAPNYLDNDIALLQLANKQTLPTSSLPDDISQQTAEAVVANRLETLGWGATNPEGDQLANKLQYVRLQFLPFNQCLDVYSLTDNMLCAWEPNPPEEAPDGQDTCRGDSGGPLFVSLEDLPFVVGITSFGVVPCGLDGSSQTPGGYTRVINYLDWIEQMTSDSGDPLVAVRASIPNGLMSGSDGDGNLAQVPISVHNDSLRNSATGVGFQLQLPGELTLEGWDTSKLDCTGGPSEWQCHFLASPLLANTYSDADIDLRYSGTQSRVAIQAQAFADQDNYRAGRRNSGPVDVVYTDEPVLEIDISTNTSSNSATLSYTVRNLSSHADAEDTLLEIDLPGGLSLSASNHEGCQASAEGVSCTLGTLAAGSDVSLSVTLAGSTGSYTVTSSLSTSNGIFPDDIVTASSAFRIAAKTHSSSSGGGSAGIVALLLILLPGYRRRNQRSTQSSN